jgi:thiol-disulfide isomerase/thioredoxin
VTELFFGAAMAAPSRAPRALTEDQVSAVSGRWRVEFAADGPAVGVFDVAPGGRASGTFLTPLGDYRYLAGWFDGATLRLSCFDGAHAFLFRATLSEDGSLAGDFWSRDSWHDTWTAVKDETAELPDDFGVTRWTGAVALDDAKFPGLDGTVRSLADPAFAGRARLLVVFGTWCPNCNDLTEYLVELDARYEGLSILGVAFEYGEDLEVHRRTVSEYLAHHDATYPVLLGGNLDKKRATQAFPLLDRVRAYPTTVFMDGEGEVRAVHTGFSGPATGERHGRLRERFEAEIEAILSGD